eukprot:987212-Prorocentrum_minimum.AAC.1
MITRALAKFLAVKLWTEPRCRPSLRFGHFVAPAGPFTVLNDAYNANPLSMSAALRTLKEARCTSVIGVPRSGPEEAEKCTVILRSHFANSECL